jgi:hypothetical protein
LARPLINVPVKVKRGETFEIKTLISHVMEPGYRFTTTGARLPRKLMIEIDSIPANNERTGLPSDIMSRRRRRNDILPLLMITQHPLRTTDKSAFSPFYKIALHSTPG